MEYIDRISALSRTAYIGELALSLADHDRRLPDALALARAERQARRDIYTQDVVAWTLYKNGRAREALEPMTLGGARARRPLPRPAGPPRLSHPGRARALRPRARRRGRAIRNLIDMAEIPTSQATQDAGRVTEVGHPSAAPLAGARGRTAAARPARGSRRLPLTVASTEIIIPHDAVDSSTARPPQDLEARVTFSWASASC